VRRARDEERIRGCVVITSRQGIALKAHCGAISTIRVDRRCIAPLTSVRVIAMARATLVCAIDTHVSQIDRDPHVCDVHYDAPLHATALINKFNNWIEGVPFLENDILV
jgi:hypothetical protein